MNNLTFPTVILGAGAMGAATAYHLAKRGQPVALVEQFALGHDLGSSHGTARIIRHSYADPVYARLMPTAFREWRHLEADAGESFYIRTGGISLCPPEVDYVAKVAASLSEIGCPHRVMSGLDLWKILPVFRFPDETSVVFEPDAGMLSAAKAIEAQVALARHFGGDSMRVFENCRVRRIDLDGEKPVLITDSGTITAERLIVAAGPWTGRLIPSLGSRLHVERQQVLYITPDDRQPINIGRFPIFIYIGADKTKAYYGMPPFLGRGLKIARHGGDVIDPDQDDRTVEESYLADIRKFLEGYLPSLADAPIEHTEICKYTIAPDDHFLVGPLPDHPNVIAASPCSGHGFKFSCLIGRILADLALTGVTDVDISPWRIGPAS